ncbi:hypothetical protein [Bradyrhizobium sp. 33ap4]|uniref:hypothetical protein n=1 Tax=Bradyrhizobium sp. 33ap4 TaxID=3061630 RepID=UPI00292D0860|nr:hypothetical protein [Bradyrhizobium sp. 33ap4]
MLLRLASAVLRGAAALHRKRTISNAGLRTALSLARCVERAGARVMLGRASQPALINTKDENSDRID